MRCLLCVFPLEIAMDLLSASRGKEAAARPFVSSVLAHRLLPKRPGVYGVPTLFRAACLSTVLERPLRHGAVVGLLFLCLFGHIQTDVMI